MRHKAAITLPVTAWERVIPQVKEPLLKKSMERQLDESTLGRQLKAWRIRTGLSQSVSAKHIGVPVRSLQEWEQGRRIPGGETRKQIRQAISL